MARGTKWRRYKVITLMFFATNDTFTIAAKKGLSWCRLVPQLHEICNCYRPFPDFGAFLFWKEWLWGFSSLFLKENNVKSSVDSTVVLQYRAAGFPRPLVHAATKTKSYCQHLYQLNEFHRQLSHWPVLCIILTFLSSRDTSISSVEDVVSFIDNDLDTGLERPRMALRRDVNNFPFWVPCLRQW